MSSEARKNSEPLLPPTLLTEQQRKAIDFICNKDAGVIVAGTGVGKTIMSLTAIAEHGGKWIVAAPPNVIAGWPTEASKWEHTCHLKLALLNGTPEQREKKLASDWDIALISLNSLTWLLEHRPNATNIIIDELSKAAGKQTAKLKTKKFDYITKRIGLTATPVSESFEKLYSMLRILDKGAALGTNKQRYLDTFFYPTDFKRYNWKLSVGSDSRIMDIIKHLIHDVEVNKADTLPPIEYEDVVFTMPDQTRKLYDTMRKDLLIEGNDSDVVAANMAVLSGKLRQISCGFVIDEAGEVIESDTRRAQTAVNLLDECPSGALMLYEYNHQREQLERLLDKKGVRYQSVYGGSDKNKAIQAFKDNQIDVLVAQINTLSHGTNGLQYCTDTVIFTQPVWSNDANEQAVGRVWRQGQTRPVTIFTVVCDDTIDDLVLTRLENKGENMKAFLAHLRG